jgi:hypothetical protein
VRWRGGVREMKCVVVPSIAVSMLPDKITLSFRKLSWDEFVAEISKCERVINYIRHKPTNDLLSTITTFETGFEYKIGDDIIFLVALRTRAPTPGADVNVTPEDLLVYLVKPV